MLTKVLEQKSVIRLFGLALTVAPFLNILFSGYAILSPGEHLTATLFWEFARGVPGPFKILEIASLLIGGLMLRGSVSAWRYLLILLGGYIVMQFVQLGHHHGTDKTSWLFIGVNVLVFFFIADQLVLKPRPLDVAHTAPAPAAAPVARPVSSPVSPDVAVPAVVKSFAPRTSRKNIVIDLNGFGKWAKLVDISQAGLRVRCLGNVPQGISSRILCVTLGGVDLQLHYARQLDREVVFEWMTLSQHQVQSLNNWIRAISA